ncbi:MAG: acyl-CoA reductase [Bacteroidales bacterium]|nr:acyl-CoA reductase [Bacteroidales bacterium]
MYNKVFTDDFSALGAQLTEMMRDLSGESSLKSVIELSYRENPLFTPNMQIYAILSICREFLDKRVIEEWLSPYQHKIEEREKTVLIVMAGNIPMVGFHDLLAALACGYKAEVKLSSKDRYLIPYLYKLLSDYNPYWSERVFFTETLPGDADIVIASGSDTTSDFLKSKYPSSHAIIRGSRYSVALLRGNESRNDLENLAKDIFLYYGLGCRSVSSLLVPVGYDFTGLLSASCSMSSEVVSDDYISSYKYQKALCTMSSTEFIDGGFFIMVKSGSTPPPLGVINIQEYDSLDEVSSFLEDHLDKLQCVVNYKEGVTFGNAQNPAIDQYADGVNTLDFLLQFV